MLRSYWILPALRRDCRRLKMVPLKFHQPGWVRMATSWQAREFFRMPLSETDVLQDGGIESGVVSCHLLGPLRR